MAIFTNQIKNISSWESLRKYIIFLATESQLNILCENGDELILDYQIGDTAWSNQIKN